MKLKCFFSGAPGITKSEDSAKNSSVEADTSTPFFRPGVAPSR